VEEQIREETVELDHDSGCDREPDGRKDRSSGEELFHGAVLIRGGNGDFAVHFRQLLAAEFSEGGQGPRGRGQGGFQSDRKINLNLFCWRPCRGWL
jgi:hypothetical protein